MGVSKARPAINDGLCEWCVVMISRRQAHAAPRAEDFHEIARVALEVLSFRIAVWMGGGLGSVAELLRTDQYGW
jgi:hypothetical protein